MGASILGTILIAPNFDARSLIQCAFREKGNDVRALSIWSGLRRRDGGNARFDDPGFFESDLRQCFAEPLLVIERDRRKHADQRRDHIRGVEPSSHAGFENRDLRA